MKNFKKLSKDQLKQVNGGMRWIDDGCRTYSVEDRRPGAGPVWLQKVKTFAHNFWYCSEHL